MRGRRRIRRVAPKSAPCTPKMQRSTSLESLTTGEMPKPTKPNRQRMTWETCPPELEHWQCSLSEDGTEIRCMHGKCSLKQFGNGTRLATKGAFKYRYLRLRMHITDVHGADTNEDRGGGGGGRGGG